MPGTTKAPEPLLSLAFVSHMCSRTALLKPPHWLFSSVARAVCLRRKAQLCHLNNPPPSAAPAPGAVWSGTRWRRACRHCLGPSGTPAFPGSQAGWAMTNLHFSAGLQWFQFVRNKTTAISNEDKNLLGIQTCCSWGNTRLLLLLGVSSQMWSLQTRGIRPWTKSSQIYSTVSVLCRLNLCSRFNSSLLLSWTFISVETVVWAAGLRFQGVMQKDLRDASEVFYPYQCAILRVKPDTS